MAGARRGGREVRQRPAKPRTPVRIRSAPLSSRLPAKTDVFRLELKSLFSEIPVPARTSACHPAHQGPGRHRSRAGTPSPPLIAIVLTAPRKALGRADAVAGGHGDRDCPSISGSALYRSCDTGVGAPRCVWSFPCAHRHSHLRSLADVPPHLSRRVQRRRRLDRLQRQLLQPANGDRINPLLWSRRSGPASRCFWNRHCRSSSNAFPVTGAGTLAEGRQKVLLPRVPLDFLPA
jgi:hypothetical protein